MCRLPVCLHLGKMGTPTAFAHVGLTAGMALPKERKRCKTRASPHPHRVWRYSGCHVDAFPLEVNDELLLCNKGCSQRGQIPRRAGDQQRRTWAEFHCLAWIHARYCKWVNPLIARFWCLWPPYRCCIHRASQLSGDFQPAYFVVECESRHREE